MPGFVVLTEDYHVGDATHEVVIAIAHRHIQSVQVLPYAPPSSFGGAEHLGWSVAIRTSRDRHVKNYIANPTDPDGPTLDECRAAAYAFGEEITSQTLNPDTFNEANPF